MFCTIIAATLNTDPLLDIRTTTDAAEVLEWFDDYVGGSVADRDALAEWLNVAAIGERFDVVVNEAPVMVVIGMAVSS